MTTAAAPPPAVWVAAMHWSQNAPAWCGFFEQFMSGRAVCQFELTWYGRTPERAAIEFKLFCEQQQIELAYTVLDHRRFTRGHDEGESVAETFEAAGIAVLPSHTDRVAGFSRVRSWFDPIDWPDGVRGPGLRFHSRCQAAIRTLPTLISDTLNPDDVEETVDSYPALGVSYWAMSRPMPATPISVEMPPDAIGHDVEELRRAARQSYYGH